MDPSSGVRIFLSVWIAMCLVVGARAQSVVTHGPAGAVIVTPNGPFHTFVAGQFQRYTERMTGARLEIVGADQGSANRRDMAEFSFSVLGGNSGYVHLFSPRPWAEEEAEVFWEQS